ncbi:serine hydrolase [Bacillus sp. FJAT-49736]|uniref:serine hydrolase domain-containing protein n=1 Tax=Bacillus sp. FJAT-49736 TaxID=2833582 RepID=UPI001BC9F48D|nr:serine hydrolase [Bacillus sp. FJAT-49736]MBS4172182.1 serine hydrolase [Bacillus sp. FJAT-49736]
MKVIDFTDLEKKLKSVKIEGFIINKGNERLFEYLKNKKIKEKPTKIYSVTKSIVSLLIGISVDKGLIQDIHQPIHCFFPELKNSNETSKREITIFHLLTMTSGFQATSFQGAKNWVKVILEQPILHKPGSTFQYNSGDSHLLSAIIHKVSGEPAATFAEKYLFGPLGIKKYLWVKDPQGIYGGGFSISLSIEDMMKVGQMLLNDGKFSSKQIISSKWLEQSQRPYKQVEISEFGTYGYGFQLWTYESNDSKNYTDYYYANGLFGQYIFIVPKLEIVAVVKSQLQNNDQSLPKQFFQKFLRSL